MHAYNRLSLFTNYRILPIMGVAAIDRDYPLQSVLATPTYQKRSAGRISLILVN